MFRALISSLDRQNPGQLGQLRYYLERHIGIDEVEHTPLALAMLEELCGTDDLKWREAGRAVDTAVAARLALWDGIHVRVTRQRARFQSGFRRAARADLPAVVEAPRASRRSGER